MKKIITIVFIATTLACNGPFNEKINGNGNQVTQTRNVNVNPVIKSLGSFDVVLHQGTPESVQVTADENLMPYILVENKDGALEIRTKDGVNLSSDRKIKIDITTNRIEQLLLAGSGNITNDGKFTGGDKLKLSIAGSGNITMDVNTPDIDADIAGSGDISLQGETRSAEIKIAGVGNYKAENLKAESVKVDIMGSRNVNVFASTSLDVNIAGSGDIYYRGSPNIKQHIAGSGSIKQMP